MPMSKIISDLEANIKLDKDKSVKEFIDYIKINGTPIIEEIDEMFSFVTYILIGDDKTYNAIIVPDGEGFDRPDEYTMERIEDTSIFYLTVKVSNDIIFDYRISINDDYGDDIDKRWENSIYDINNPNKVEIKDEEGNVVKVRGSYVVMKDAPKFKYTLEKSIVQKGKIEKQELLSQILKNKRNIYIYLPHNYLRDNGMYKTLILTDGNDYLKVLNAKNALDNLIYEGVIPPIAAIFITHTEERNNELACNDEFINFIISEILPWTRNTYNISQKPEDNIIGGLSFGGLSAMYCGLRHSDVFGNVLCQSGSFWWSPDNNDGTGNIRNFIAEEFERVNKSNLKIYMEVGEIESKKYIIYPNEQLRDLLISKGYNVNYSTFKAGHDYLLWGETLAKGIKWLINS